MRSSSIVSSVTAGLVLTVTAVSWAAEPADAPSTEGEPFIDEEPATSPTADSGTPTAGYPSAGPWRPAPSSTPEDRTSPPPAGSFFAPKQADVTRDRPEAASDELGGRGVKSKRILHGFRMGYLFLTNYDQPTDSPDDPECPNCSLKEKYKLKTPHQFLMGYELMARMVGHEWLNVILVGNVMASGLEQSRFFPSGNALIGFELDRSFQVGVGANVTLEEEKPAHMIVAAGWTPEVGGFYVPVHAFFIPDVDQNHRTGATVGVNW